MNMLRSISLIVSVSSFLATILLFALEPWFNGITQTDHSVWYLLMLGAATAAIRAVLRRQINSINH